MVCFATAIIVITSGVGFVGPFSSWYYAVFGTLLSSATSPWFGAFSTCTWTVVTFGLGFALELGLCLTLGLASYEYAFGLR